jgi:hypothetical protein
MHTSPWYHGDAAPTNDAFAAIPQETVDFYLLPENVEQLQAILLYHVLAGAVPSSDIVPGPVPTLNGLTVELAVSDDGAITVNDANVSAADISASNGIVHVIDKVLLPPTTGTTASTDAPAADIVAVRPTEVVVAVDPTEAAPAEPAMSLPAAVTIDPAVSMPASMPADDALFGGKSGKGSKSKAMKKTPKSGKALPVKDAKAEKVKSISTKVAKTEAVPARR